MSTLSGVDAHDGEHGAGGPAPPIGVLRIDPNAPTRMLRLSQVIERMGLKKTTIYALQKTGEFPHSVPLTANSVRWIEAEIEAWIQKRKSARGQPQSG
jgi:prophage regulatory protein